MITGSILPLYGLIFHDDRKPLVALGCLTAALAADEVEYLLYPTANRLALLIRSTYRLARAHWRCLFIRFSSNAAYSMAGPAGITPFSAFWQKR